MRVLLRAGKWILVTFFGLAAIVAAAAVLLWEKPTLVLNEKTVRWARRFAPTGTQVDWSFFRWEFSREGWLAKGMRLEIHDLCFRYGAVADGCLPTIAADLSFTVRGFHPRVSRLGEFTVIASRLRIHPPPARPAPEATLPDLRPPRLAPLLPFDPAAIGDVVIRVDRFELGAAPPLAGSFALAKPAGSEVVGFNSSVSKTGGLRAALSGRGTLAKGRLILAGTLNAETSWKIRFPFHLNWDDRVELTGEPAARFGKNLYATPLRLDWRADRVSLEARRLTLDKLWPRKRVLFDACKIVTKLDAKAGYPAKSTLGCDLALMSLERGAILPPMRAALNADLALAPAGRHAASAELHVSERGRNDYLESEVSFHGAGKFDLAKPEPMGDPKMELHSVLRVPALSRWRASLDRTPLALPAPFRTLDGPASLTLDLEHVDRRELRVKSTLATDFHGERQAFVTRHQALVRLANPFGPRGKSLDVDAHAELTDVALEAPPLQLGAPPQFFPDRRFEASRADEAAETKASAIPLHWRAALTTKAPVRIRTNLLENEIPVALDLSFGDAGRMAGTLAIEPLPIAVFKKKAELKSLTVTFHEGSAAGDVNGTILYRNPEITIRILLLGSTEKPRVEFLSDPPLDRQQIVAVLLFNKSPSELTEEESSSAGSFSQATADGALGLFSLFFLSSTPVESIAYDPVTQTYSARLRLDKKTTLSVGSDFDRERQVALRRRLGGRFAIRTELHNQQGQPDVLLTLLEWFKRF
jgi:hypothetical protein